jgi:hypothetical protein
VLGPSPANPHTRQGSPDSLSTHPLFGEPLLETHFSSHLHRPQAALLAELPGAPMEHLAQSLGPFGIEGPMNGERAVRASSERLGKALLVELVDGIARGLRVTAEVAGDLVGVLPSALLSRIWQRRKVKASGERKPASRVLRSASVKGRTKIGRFIA